MRVERLHRPEGASASGWPGSHQFSGPCRDDDRPSRTEL